MCYPHTKVTRKAMTARCPVCEAVHPVPAHQVAHELVCPCGATALLCAPNTEPGTSVQLAEMGLSDTKADILDDRQRQSPSAKKK